MKQITFLGLFLFLLLGTITSNAQTTKTQPVKKLTAPKVEVFYFHFAQRCTTCLAVEANCKGALNALYTDKVKSGEYTFQSLDIEDAKSKALVQKLKVGGQTLLVVSGSKKVDITSKAFMYAQDKNKIKAELKKAVEKALTK